MGVLTKILINSTDSIDLAVWQIQNYIRKNPEKVINKLVILDSNGKIHLANTKFIPQMFNHLQVFISSESFQQTNSNIGMKIRRWVCNLISQLNPVELLCVGGESYLYGLTLAISKIYHLTNSLSIYDDCEFNQKFFTSLVSNNLVDYNKIRKIDCDYQIGLINLSNLNINLIKKINQSNLKTLIIINCHHEDFWKKIKLLSHYKIVQRKLFICPVLKYFISVNILIKN